jgi:general secretion pathway protein A
VYAQFYNLRDEPFRLTSDPRFFHLAEPHGLALNTLIEAVMRRKGFAVLTGPIGTGKTTVLHAALRILTEKSTADGLLASAFILNPLLTRDEFLEMVLAEFEIPCAGASKPARLAALQHMLLNFQSKGGTSVLLVDEAHLLSPELLEEIRLLSNADTYPEKPLQIILCGQPELLTFLQRPELRALRQRIASSCALRPLTLPELRVYVAERLYTAGLQNGVHPFSSSAIDSIFHYTQGVPRLINLLCDASLTIGWKTQRNLIQVDIVEQAAAELGVAPASTATALPDKVIFPSNGSERDPAMHLRQAITASDSAHRPAVSAALEENIAAALAGNPHDNPHEAIVQTALDLLILAMKQRRNSTRSSE